MSDPNAGIDLSPSGRTLGKRAPWVNWRRRFRQGLLPVPAPQPVPPRGRAKNPIVAREQELLGRLARTEELILRGKGRIREQQLLIYSLELRGRATTSAKYRLEQLAESQALYEAQWRAILDALKR